MASEVPGEEKETISPLYDEGTLKSTGQIVPSKLTICSCASLSQNGRTVSLVSIHDHTELHIFFLVMRISNIQYGLINYSRHAVYYILLTYL